MVIKNLFFSILCISKLVVASDNEGVSFFYDERTNTEWVCGKQLFSKLNVDAPAKNYVFWGEFSSSSDIDLRAKNLIILGSLMAVNTIKLRASNEVFTQACITADFIDMAGDERKYIGLKNDEAITKIQALGIDINFCDTARTSLKVMKPSRN